jgi:hypothetical protein
MIAATISVAPAIMLASPLHAHVSGNCTVQNSDGYANVRSRPTTHAPILLQLKNGTRVSAYDVHHRWLWIKGTIGTKETVTGWTRRWALSCDKPLRWRWGSFAALLVGTPQCMAFEVSLGRLRPLFFGAVLREVGADEEAEGVIGVESK